MKTKRKLTLIIAVMFILATVVGFSPINIQAFADTTDVYTLSVKNLSNNNVTTYDFVKDANVTLYEEYKLASETLNFSDKVEVKVLKNGTAVQSTTKTLEKGNYVIKFSPSIYYASTGLHINVTRAQNKDLKVYIFASYNKYQKEAEVDGVVPNQMKYNEAKLEYDEYILEHIEIEYNDEDFYLSVEDPSTTPATVTTVKDGGSKFEFKGKGIYTVRYAPDLKLDNAEKVRIEFESEIPVPETIEIYNEKEFVEFATKTKVDGYSREKKVLLMSDLDFADKEFVPIGHFNGTFEGNGNTIKNVKISGNGSYAGIFRYVGSKGVVRDLTVEANVELFESQNFIGGIVGSNSGLIENCVFKGYIKGNNSIGGIVGINEFVENDVNKTDDDVVGTIKNCVNQGDIRGYGNIGGIAGSNKGEIYNSTNNGKINAVDYLSSEESKLLSIGGIVGFDTGRKISGCVNNGVVGYSKIGNFVGGIVGMGVGVITECANNGKVVGNTNVGGVLGYNASFTSTEDQKLITEQLAKLLMLNFGIDIGSTPPEDEEWVTPELLLKQTNSTTNYSYNTGNVVGESNVGGVIGYMNSGNNLTTAVSACFNKGIVNSNKGNVGGVVGNHLSGTFESCFNTGEVRSDGGSNVGGVVGISNNEIKTSYAICDVIGKSYVGGIVGKGLHVTNCYTNTTIIADGEFIGAIAGKLDGRATFNYYIYSSVDGIDDISYVRQVTRLTVDELASQNTLSQKLTGFDSVDWVAGYGKPHYPILRAFDECGENCENQEIIKVLKDESTNSTLQTFRILFVDEKGNHVFSIKAGYNQSVGEFVEPKVPNKEGYFGLWDSYERENITKDQRVNPIYVKEVSSIASDNSLTPLMFVNGVLHPDVKLEVKELPFDKDLKVKGKNVLNKYSVSATLFGEKFPLEGCQFKVYVPNEVEKPQIGKTMGGGTEIIDGQMQGSYLMFEAYGIDDFTVLYSKPLMAKENLIIIGISALCGCALMGGAILIGFGIKKKVKNKKKLKDADTADTPDDASEKNISDTPDDASEKNISDTANNASEINISDTANNASDKNISDSADTASENKKEK